MDQERFRARANRGHHHGFGVVRFSLDSQPQAQQSARTLRFVFSDGSVDRYGDTIDPTGWDLDDYRRNNVALWAHDSSLPPIGRGLNVSQVGNRLMGDIEFAEAELNPFADTIYRMYHGGFLSAVSVGFMPLEWNFVNDPDRPYGIEFKRQTLMEISCVPVPALPSALIEARASGIDTTPMIGWAEKMLDEGGMQMVPRTELEALRKAAGAATPVPIQSPASSAVNQDVRTTPAVKESKNTPALTVGDVAVDDAASLVVDVLPLIRRLDDVLRALDGILAGRVAEREPARDTSVSETRAGRVLSGENEATLRVAHDLMTQACDKVIGVIGQVEPPQDDSSQDEPAQDDPRQDDETEATKAKARRLRRARALRFLKLTAPAA
jgi:HK97 family phage prohead protease